MADARSPLRGKRLLITRPATAVESFVTALHARGIEPVLASTIAIAPPDDTGPAHRAIDQLASFAWLVFTSQHGVDAFFDRLYSLNADARYIGKTKVAAIGSKTAERLRERGIRADLVPSGFVGEELARALIEASHNHDRVLVYRAQDGRDALPRMLEDAGRLSTVVAAYKTVFEADPQFGSKVERADIVTFTSGSTVRGYVELLGGTERAIAASRGKTIACIGPIAAETAQLEGLHVDLVADVSTTDGLLDALESYLAPRV